MTGVAFAYFPQHSGFFLNLSGIESMRQLTALCTHAEEQLEAGDSSFYRPPVVLVPDHASSLFRLGRLACARNHATIGIMLIQKALLIAPHSASAEVLFFLGIAQHGCGQISEAESSWRYAIAVEPCCVDPWMSLTKCILHQTSLDPTTIEKTKTILSRFMAMVPDFADIYILLGHVMYQGDQMDMAKDYFKKHLCLVPDFFDSYFLLGNIYDVAGEISQAESLWKIAMKIKPTRGEPHCNFGIVSRAKGQKESAMISWRKAIVLNPDYPPTYTNLADFIEEQKLSEKALVFGRRSVILSPDDPKSQINLAMSLLALGRFEEGWIAYEWRWNLPIMLKYPRKNGVQWSGEDGNGRTLLIYAEQGFGDSLQFARYAPMAAARGWSVVLEMPVQLMRLMRSLKGIDQLIEAGNTLPHYDMHCPLQSLPMIFGTKPDNIPSSPAYLYADPEKSLYWSQRLGLNHGNVFRVGIVCAGDPRDRGIQADTIDKRRSISWELVRPLFQLTGKICFFNLQKVFPVFPNDFPIINFMDEMYDFSDTAALIDNLDLVITVDTSVVHLVGALGKPVWMLDRFDHCWRWLKGRNDSPWYPSLRIFRQTKPGDWVTVIELVKEALKKMIN